MIYLLLFIQVVETQLIITRQLVLEIYLFNITLHKAEVADIALISNDDGGEKTTIRQKVVDANNSYMLFRTRDAGSLVSTMILSGSKVGIGTILPVDKLHVSGGALRVNGAASYIDVGKFGGYQSTIRADSHTPLEIRGNSGYGANLKYVRNNGSYGFFSGMLEDF